MKTLKNLILAGLLGTLFLTIVSFYQGVGDEWVVPDNYLKMANPVKSSTESIATGKELYAKHCQSCHGKFGEGDGPKAAELKKHPGDFTDEKFQKQSDGSLFYKITVGRDEMTGFRKKLTDDEDVWSVINYVRTLKGE